MAFVNWCKGHAKSYSHVPKHHKPGLQLAFHRPDLSYLLYCLPSRDVFKNVRTWVVIAVLAVLGVGSPAVVATANDISRCSNIAPRVATTPATPEGAEAFVASTHDSIADVWQQQLSCAKSPVELWSGTKVVATAAPFPDVCGTCAKPYYLDIVNVRRVLEKSAAGLLTTILAGEYATHIHTWDLDHYAPDRELFTACAMGLYLGVLEHSGLTDELFRASYLTALSAMSKDQQAHFMVGRTHRSINDCLD